MHNNYHYYDYTSLILFSFILFFFSTFSNSQDSPELYGLHANADLTFRLKEATLFIDTLCDTQPKVGGGSNTSSTRTLEDVIMEKTNELLQKLPPEYIEDEYRARFRKLGGLNEPMNLFLFQEIQRFQKVLTFVKSILTSMQAAVRGEIILTTELLNSMTDIFNGRVPKNWILTPGNDEFSWLITSLGTWYVLSIIYNIFF